MIIELYCEPDLPLVKCERNQLKQVFVNMIKNAIEAMPTGGCLNVLCEKGCRRCSSLFHRSRTRYIGGAAAAHWGTLLYDEKRGRGLGVMLASRLSMNIKDKSNIKVSLALAPLCLSNCQHFRKKEREWTGKLAFFPFVHIL